MKEIEKLLEPLSLIYYEYDAKANALIPDAKWSKEHILDELIKITHMLTTHHKPFYVDDRQHILLKSKESLLQKLKRHVINLYANIQNSNKNIYVLSDKKVKWAKNLPVFEVKHLAFDGDLGAYDGLVFTSKNAIYSLAAQNKLYKKMPSYVIAPQTAKVLKSVGGSLKFVGKEKHGDAFAYELLEKFHGKKLLYLRGESVVSNLVGILNDGGVVCDEAVVYKTQCRVMPNRRALPKGATIIFSSPSTIECFLKNFEWDESYRAIAIGKTTAAYMPEHMRHFIAETTSLDSCVKRALELYEEQR